MSEPLAHSGGHLLAAHLQPVADMAADFSEVFEPEVAAQRWAYLAGFRPDCAACMQFFIANLCRTRQLYVDCSEKIMLIHVLKMTIETSINHDKQSLSFALSLSKGPLSLRRTGFDKLRANGEVS